MRDVAEILGRAMKPRLRKIGRTAKQVWIVPIGLILGVTAIALDISYNPVGIASAQDRATLTILVQILAATFAITSSILMVTSQFVSQTYTPRVSRILFEDRTFLGYFAVYILSIAIILGSLALDLALLSRLSPYAFSLFLFCQVYLVFLLVRVPRILHPFHLLDRMAKKVDKDFCEILVKRGSRGIFIFETEDEPIATLEQVLIKSVVQNDFLTFLRGSGHVESILSNFLSKTRKELASSHDPRPLRDKPFPVLEYFLRIYRQLIAEALSGGREQHLSRLCYSLSQMIVELHQMRSFHALQSTSKLFDYSGLSGVEKGLLSFLETYSGMLSHVVENQLTTLEEPLFPFEGMDESWEKLTEQERDLRTVRSMMFDFSFTDRIQSLSVLAELAARHWLDSAVNSCMYNFHTVLNKTLSLKPERKRRSITTMVLFRIEDTHKKCVDRGMNATTFTTHLLHYHIEALAGQNPDPELSRYVMAVYAKMGKYSIEHGLYDEIWGWGVNGRALVRNYPEEAMFALDVLEKALEVLTASLTEENLGHYEQTRKDVESLRSWANHSNKAVTQKVESLLAKFGQVSNLRKMPFPSSEGRQSSL